MHAWLLSCLLAFQAFTQNAVFTTIPEGVESQYVTPIYETQAMDSIQKNPTMIAPVISSTSALAVDRESGKILYSQKAYEKLPIASITKLMTALVVREKADLNEIVTVSDSAANVEGAKMRLQANDTLTVYDLLRGLLIHSGNDAAIALAEHVGNGEVEEFVVSMNEKKDREKLLNTNFANPMGFDHPDNYSTAYDVYRMADLVLDDPILSDIVKTASMVIESTQGNEYRLKNTNQILGGYLNISGVKTGTTDLAGMSLVSVSRKDDKEIIAVLLHSPSRFQEMKIMLDWCYRAYTWSEGKVLGDLIQ